MLDNLSFPSDSHNVPEMFISRCDETIDRLVNNCEKLKLKLNSKKKCSLVEGHRNNPTFGMLNPTEHCYGEGSYMDAGCCIQVAASGNIWSANRMIGSGIECIRITWKYGMYNLTLIASVQITAMTSKDLLKTRLVLISRSYSQITMAVSTAAILVMWAIILILARLTTCSRQLKNVRIHKYLEYWILVNAYGNWFVNVPQWLRFWHRWRFSTVKQIVPFVNALSSLTIPSWVWDQSILSVMMSCLLTLDSFWLKIPTRCYNFSFSCCNSWSHVPTCHAHACRLTMLLHSYLTHHLYNHMASYTCTSLTCTSASPQLCTLLRVLRPHPDILA